MTPEQRDGFKEAFRSKQNDRGEVSAPALAKLCKELGIGKAPALVQEGLVRPHKAEKRISCYTLVGEDTAPAVTEPTLAEMQRLFNEEPRLRAGRATLDAEKAEFEAHIAAQRSEFEAAFRQKTEVLDRKIALIDGVRKNLTNIKHLLGED